MVISRIANDKIVLPAYKPLPRSNPCEVNEAILVFGDVHGQVNALLFSAATITLFDRPSQPAGSKQGNLFIL